jgi:hypothetical protein
LVISKDVSDRNPLLPVAVGAAYGTSKAGIGIAGLGTFKPELIMKVRFLMAYAHSHL